MDALSIFTLVLCFASCYAAQKDVRIVVNNNSRVPLLARDANGNTKLLFPGEKKEFKNGETTTVDVFRLCPTATDSQYTRVRKEMAC